MPLFGRVALVLLLVDLFAGLVFGHWVDALLRWEWATLHAELGR